jgi:PhoPQ-activated pathogenicity-related protein
MTKAAVRAMDTITAFMATPEGGRVPVDRFVVSGGSKRGWTTWTTAAVDKRVVAIIPMSIDMLNIEKSFEHHWRVYGFWAPAVKDYVEAGLMDWNGTPQYREMQSIEEPYSYRDRITIPKFIVNASGDQFFLPDSSRFYFDNLEGEKHLRYLPNTNHHREGTDYRESNIAFYEAFLSGAQRPRFTWKFEDNGDIRVDSKDRPSAVKLWQAANPEHRDFRMMTIGPAYRASDVTERAKGVYIGHVDTSAKGWTAYFIEMTYPSGGKYPFKFTTSIRIAPDTEPFPPYDPKPRTQIGFH